MITSRFKACEEYIKDDFNGLIVEQNNQEELIDAMKKLLNSRQLQKNLSSNFLQSSHQFNIDVLIKKLLTNLTNKGWDI